MKVRKAVFPAAGWGTRFLPATKAVPKEMIPLVDKPTIQYGVEEAVAAGLSQMIVITAGGKKTIEDHFDRSFELESVLAKGNKTELLAAVRAIPALASVAYIRQGEQLGLGHAIGVARELVGNEPFAVILSDDIIDHPVGCLAQMLRVYERYGASVLAVERVPDDLVSAYGIIRGQQVDDRVHRVDDLVEKPPLAEAPSNLGIVGRYLLTPEIFDCIARTKPGRGGEIQITDALRLLRQQQEIYALEFEGTRYDTGNPLGFLKATVDQALRRPDLAEDFRVYLRTLQL
ncbi:MAG: UTP--glucose-1-phosphate uridylyltransferase GalU [Chloroflexi bacterium]|nr:UTP--glucose-1-phosphate uridylyltransferase GalU [Chloroflexota bacterium]